MSVPTIRVRVIHRHTKVVKRRRSYRFRAVQFLVVFAMLTGLLKSVLPGFDWPGIPLITCTNGVKQVDPGGPEPVGGGKGAAWAAGRMLKDLSESKPDKAAIRREVVGSSRELSGWVRTFKAAWDGAPPPVKSPEPKGSSVESTGTCVPCPPASTRPGGGVVGVAETSRGQRIGLASFNIRGASHTGAASARARLPRAVAAVRRAQSDVVGWQEMQRLQRDMAERALPEFTFWSAKGDTDNSVSWRRSVFQGPLPGSRFVTIRYGRGDRSMPLVRLKYLPTGKALWFLNVHNPAIQVGGTPGQRAAAVGEEVETLRRVTQASGEQGYLMGDMNARGEFYRQVTAAGMVPAGGPGKAIDWIVGTPGTRFLSHEVDQSTNRGSSAATGVTDHPLVTATIPAPGEVIAPPVGSSVPTGELDGVDVAARAALSQWGRDDAVTAVAIAGAESGWRHDAWNPRSVGGSTASGMWQTMMPMHASLYRGDSWKDPMANARVAHVLWKSRGWRPWTVYTSGAYRSKLDEARAAVDRAAGTSSRVEQVGYERPSRAASRVKGDSRLTPAARRAQAYIQRTWKIPGGIGGWAGSGHMPGSEHYSGNALDVMTMDDKALGKRIFDYFRGPGYRPFHVQNVIHNRQIYNTGKGLHAYTGDSPHTSHVHIDFVHGAPGTGSAPAPDPGVDRPAKNRDCVSPGPLPDDGKGTTGPAPMPLPARVVGVYYMAFSDNPRGLLESTPAGANVVYLSFLQGDPPSLTHVDPQLVADVRTLRARGVRVIGSVGGERGPTNISNTDGFVRGVMAVNRQVPLDGLDWDIEGGDSWNTEHVVRISTELKRLRGDGFAITMAPNGTGIDHYIPTAAALHKRGALDMIGQQFYDSPVTVDQAAGRIRQIMGAGVPVSRIGVGMMAPSGDGKPAANRWTVEQSVSNMRALQGQFPGLRGGYLWEAGRPRTADWASQVGAVIRGGQPSRDVRPVQAPKPKPRPEPAPVPARMPEPAGDVVRVMPTGDSLTEAGGANGWKGDLHEQLSAAGVAVDYVGSQTSSVGPDRQHEGHSGWQNSHFEATIGGMVQAADPDVMVYHVGTNDLWSDVPVETAAARLETVLTRALAAKPGLRVVVAQIPRMGVPEEGQRAAYNREVQAVADRLRLGGAAVTVADLSDVLAAGDLQADGIHWTATGHRKVAEALAPVVEDAVADDGGGILEGLTS